MSFFRQLVVCVVLAVAGLAGWYAYQHPTLVGFAGESAGEDAPRGGSNGSSGIPGLVGNGSVNVITAVVESDFRGDTLTALGTAKAARSVAIYPQVAGMVAEILFTPGAAVEAGAVLVRLEDEEERVAVDRAKVALEQARAALARSATLAESRTISSVALSDAETAARLAEIEVRAAEIALERRAIAAPFAGVTGLTDISLGDYVTTSTPITTLDDLSTVRVGFEVPERWTGLIRQGQAITARAQGLAGSRFAGTITALDSRVDETTRTRRVEAELDNEARALKGGMAITVELAFESDEQLAVPTLSIQWDRNGSFVWKVVEGAARRAEVVIIRRESGIVVVEGAVAAGDKVVVEGIQRLREGAKVTEVGVEPIIVDEAESAPEAPAVSGAGAPQRARS
jgi:RND family efflux transporter MFP subunit